VGSPIGPYFSSMAERIALSGFPSLSIAITSRVMLRQMSHFAPWLVKVIAPSARRSAT
jgi:hypothetical protein